MQIPRFINLVLTTTLIVGGSTYLTSCCRLPLVHCGPKISQISVSPEAFYFEKGIVKEIKIKSWLLVPRKSHSDNCTIDVELKMLLERPIKPENLNPINIFGNNNYLELGEEKYFIESTKVTSTFDKNVEELRKNTVQFYFSFKVLRNEFLSINKKYLVLDSIQIEGEQIKISAILNVTDPI